MAKVMDEDTRLWFEKSIERMDRMYDKRLKDHDRTSLLILLVNEMTLVDTLVEQLKNPDRKQAATRCREIVLEGQQRIADKIAAEFGLLDPLVPPEVLP